MNVSIVIVNWNSKDMLRACITSLLRETQDLLYEIIVVDAGSFDGCGEMLAAEFPRVRFFQINANVGFARANNLAFAHTRGEYVLFLNPDTELIGPAVQTLYRAVCGLPQSGAVGAKLLNSDRTLQTSCVQANPTILNQVLSSDILRRKWPDSKLWGMSALFTNTTDPQPVEAISGACLMTSRAAFERVGRFSEDYFMYAEDIDLSYKFRAAGLLNYYVSEAVVLHYGGSSSNQAPSSFAVVMAVESMWRFFRKTRGTAYALLYRASLLGPALGRILIGFAAYFFFPPSRSQSIAICIKWGAILRWSLGVNDSARRFR